MALLWGRMPRQGRIRLPDLAYHVTTPGNNRDRVFQEEEENGKGPSTAMVEWPLALLLIDVAGIAGRLSCPSASRQPSDIPDQLANVLLGGLPGAHQSGVAGADEGVELPAILM